ncbi:c-type cytochrome [Lacimicrobium alkaliphilum]|uniref:Cytochrome C oxidase Cbb3 n=1 Tax=Lacimicrobium alkaliphilum TaxID=1526571 RepID=A0A0U2QP41_9ALTE|nr:cytochrome c [Lacimicrobium alkaliphilum]ALS99435.1 cytochrome C oxidase Cbb3 [Lacimicrobium alkaliphilum]
MSCFKCLITVLGVSVLAGLGFIYSGLYPMGADDSHNAVTYWALDTLRERSVTRAAADLEVPVDLDNSERLLAGGADYNDMCAGCHLKPGTTQTDLSLGLYPQPPDLSAPSDYAGDAQAQNRKRFWIIKHGIKASGMPAWGSGHDDERIWNMVAFLQRLPELSQAQYQILTARGESDEAH